MPLIKVKENEPFELAMKRFKKQVREGRHPDRAAPARVLRQAERPQEEEGGRCAQAGAEEAEEDGAARSDVLASR